MFLYSCSNRNSESNSESNIDTLNFEDETSMDNVFSKYGVSLKLPIDWVLKDSVKSQFYGFAEDCEDTVTFCSNIVIQFAKNENKNSLEEVTDLLVSSLPERFKTLKILAINDFEADGVVLKVVDFMMLEEGVSLGSTSAFAIYDDNIISLYFTGKNFPEGAYPVERAMMMGILQSLEFETL